MTTLFCDASFDYQSVENNGENVARGKIAIADGERFKRVESVVVGKVEGLKQYINVLELTAIARAVELASETQPKPITLNIFTDSSVAMYWARAGRIKAKGVETPAHTSALDYLKRASANLGGKVMFHHISRDKNPAGKLLEAELSAGRKPHDH